ncbi:MAG: hypothetical protein R3B96_02465 [Pirellulaceae bacterium]
MLGGVAAVALIALVQPADVEVAQAVNPAAIAGDAAEAVPPALAPTAPVSPTQATPTRTASSSLSNLPRSATGSSNSDAPLRPSSPSTSSSVDNQQATGVVDDDNPKLGNSSASVRPDSHEPNSDDQESDALLDADELSGPFDLHEGLPATYRYRIGVDNGIEAVARYGKVTITQTDPESAENQDTFVAELLDRRLDLPINILRYVDEPYMSNEGENTLGRLERTRTSGMILAAESGFAASLTGEDYLGLLLDVPATFPFVDLTPAEHESEWKDEDPLLIQVQTIVNPLYDYGARRRERLMRDLGPVFAPNPRIVPIVRDLGEVEASRADQYRVVETNARYQLITVERELESRARRTTPFWLRGNEIICFDRELGRITYRRFLGSVSGAELGVSRRIVDYEMRLETQDSRVLLGIFAALSWDAWQTHDVDKLGRSELPITSIRQLGHTDRVNRYCLSPDGRWLSEHHGFGLLLHDLNSANGGIAFAAEGGHGTLYWDRESRGFVRVSVQHAHNSQEVAEFHLLRPDGTWRSGLAGVERSRARFPIEGLAMDVDHDQLLIFDSLGIRSYELRQGNRDWALSARARWLPSSVAWIGQDLFVQYMDRMLRLDPNTGVGTVIHEFQPPDEPSGLNRGLSYVPAHFHGRDQTLWVSMVQGPTEISLDPFEDLSHIPELAGSTYHVVADEANLLFAIMEGRLHVHSTEDGRQVGRCNLGRLLRDPAQMFVSRDGRRLLICPDNWQKKPLLLDFDWSEVAGAAASNPSASHE